MLIRIVSFVLVAVLGAVALAAADPAGAPTATPAPAQTSEAGIAFDQVDRMLGANATPPPVTAFAAELQAVKDAQSGPGIPHQNFASQMASQLGNMAISSIPVVGEIFAMGQAKKQAAAAKKAQQTIMDQMNGIKPPTLTHYAFYNGWTRTETADAIIITKPDRHVMIELDPRTKTYRTSDALVVNARPLQTMPSASEGTAMTSSPSSANAASSINITGADATTINDEQVTGYTEQATVTLSGGAGNCHDGIFSAKEVQYLSQLPEPLPSTSEGPLDILALPEGCAAIPQRQTSGTPPPTNLMYVYKLITVVRGPIQPERNMSDLQGMNPNAMSNIMQSATGRLPTNYQLLSERANFRNLTAADTSLFDIPAGYTEAK